MIVPKGREKWSEEDVMGLSLAGDDTEYLF